MNKKILILLILLTFPIYSLSSNSNYKEDLSLRETSIEFKNPLYKDKKNEIYITIYNNSTKNLKGKARLLLNGRQFNNDQEFNAFGNENDKIFLNYIPNINDKELKVLIIPENQKQDNPNNNFIIKKINVLDHGSTLEIYNENEQLNRVPIIMLNEFKRIISLNRNLIINASPSTDYDGKIDSIKWIHKDKVLAEGFILDHKFETTGVKKIQIQVTDNNNNTISKTINIIVFNFAAYFILIMLGIIFLLVFYYLYMNLFKDSEYETKLSKIFKNKKKIRNIEVE